MSGSRRLSTGRDVTPVGKSTLDHLPVPQEEHDAFMAITESYRPMAVSNPG